MASLATHAAVVGLGSTGRWQFVEDGDSRSVALAPKLRVGTLLAVQAAVRAGLGLAILPDFVVAEDLSTRALRAGMPKAKLSPIRAHALYRIEARGTLRMEAVMRHLRATIPAGR